LKFDHGKLEAFTGVNQITGTYVLVHKSLNMEKIVSTKKAGDPQMMELEGNYKKMLVSVDGFEVNGDTLQLLSDGELVAEFSTADEHTHAH
jgi:heat shock protein HslJ